MATKTITDEFIEFGKSTHGGWTKKQLSLLGVIYDESPPTGWKKKLIGKEIPLKNWNEFLLLKDCHFKYLNKWAKKYG